MPHVVGGRRRPRGAAVFQGPCIHLLFPLGSRCFNECHRL
ncbi:hypothetical protein L537_0561 [Bordetella hinzii 1277]|nr:hypothetical protein L537_0561 [Bordetella hinzii 1277]